MILVETNPLQESDTPNMLLFNRVMDLIEKNKHSMTASKQAYIKKQIKYLNSILIEYKCKDKSTT